MRYSVRKIAIVALMGILALGLTTTGALAQGFGSCPGGVCPIKNFFGMFGLGFNRPGPGAGGFAGPGYGMPQNWADYLARVDTDSSVDKDSSMDKDSGADKD